MYREAQIRMRGDAQEFHMRGTEMDIRDGARERQGTLSESTVKVPCASLSPHSAHFLGLSPPLARSSGSVVKAASALFTGTSVSRLDGLAFG